MDPSHLLAPIEAITYTVGSIMSSTSLATVRVEHVITFFNVSHYKLHVPLVHLNMMIPLVDTCHSQL